MITQVCWFIRLIVRYLLVFAQVLFSGNLASALNFTVNLERSRSQFKVKALYSGDNLAVIIDPAII